MTALERVQSAVGALKVFPLPSAVLFPGAILPLHIFEPRYVSMVRDALATDRIVALGGLLPGWEADYHGRPELLPICCVGAVVWSEDAEDGRLNLMLQGVARARVLEELPPDQLYREVRAELLPDAAYDGPEVELVRNAVLGLATELPQPISQALVHQAAQSHGGELADLVASALVPELERRRALLEELSPRTRLNEVLKDVSELIARTQVVRPTGPLN